MPSRHHDGGKWITTVRRLAIYLRDGFGCVWCQMSLTDLHPSLVTLDHLLPREQLGGNESSNLVTSCKACNVRRGLKTVAQYAAELGAECAPEDRSEARSYAREIVTRVRRQRRAQPNVGLARAIISGAIVDPRPIVVRARQTGTVLAPRNSASAKNVAALKRRQGRMAKAISGERAPARLR
jgi:hypothetical protein